MKQEHEIKLPQWVIGNSAENKQITLAKEWKWESSLLRIIETPHILSLESGMYVSVFKHQGTEINNLFIIFLTEKFRHL
jgi:hypothetical protein